MREESREINSRYNEMSRSSGLQKESSMHSKGISSIEALNVYRDILSSHERKEVLQYDKVYYVGRASEKHPVANGLVSRNSQAPGAFAVLKQHSQQSQQLSKSGGLERKKSNTDAVVPIFDDAENFYRIIKHDHIAYRFEVLSLLGKGSFGQVVLAIDHMKGTQVALKIIRTEPRFTRQAREEIRILETLRQMRGTNSTNPDGLDFPIVQLFEHFTFRKHICMTFELLSINLYDLLKLNKFAGLPRDRVRRISFQILKALYYVEKAGIIHCDLKPENVLLIWPPDKDSPVGGHNGYSLSNENGNMFGKDQGPTTEQQRDFVKLIDFGSSCFKKGPTYPYIQSRFYRAPEVILRLGYAQPIDIWSFGCLVAELINGLPLFPGEDEADQLACIMEILGPPPNDMIQKSPHIDRFFVEHRLENSKSSEILNFVDHMNNGLGNDVVYLPRYCSIRYPEAGGSPELLPGLSKRAGNVRGVPGSMPLLKAILEPRHRRFRRKDPQSMANLTTSSSLCRSQDEEAALMKDNELLLGFMLSCLTWSPAERVKPYKAIQNLWLRNFSKKTSSYTGVQNPNSSDPVNNRIRSMEVSQFISLKPSDSNNGPVDVNAKSTAPNDLPVLIPRRRKRLGNMFSESLLLRPTINLDVEKGTLTCTNGTGSRNSKDLDTDDTNDSSRSPVRFTKLVSSGRLPNGGLTINTISISPTKARGVESTVIGSHPPDDLHSVTSNKRVTLIYPPDTNDYDNRVEDEEKYAQINRSMENLSIRMIPTKPVLRSRGSLLSQSSARYSIDADEIAPSEDHPSQNPDSNHGSTRIISRNVTGIRPYSEYFVQTKSQATEAEDINHNDPAKLSGSVPHLNSTNGADSNVINRQTYRQAPPFNHDQNSINCGVNQPNHAHQVLIKKLTEPPASSNHSSSNNQSRLFHLIRPPNSNQGNTSTSVHHLNSNEPRLIRISNTRQASKIQISENKDADRFPNSSWNSQKLTGPSFKSVTRLDQIAPELAPKPSSRDIVLLNPDRTTGHADSYTNVNAYATSVWAPQPYYQQSHPSNVVYRRISGTYLRGPSIEIQPYSHLSEY